jgi:hypothetical protein
VSHEISLAVWDVPSPIVAGQRAKLKVGVSCPDGCNLSGTIIDVYTETGEHIGAGTLGSSAWPATTALYWAEVDLVTAEREGDVSLSVRALPASPHAEARSVVTFFVSRPLEHRVTLEVIDKDSGLPLNGVELRLGRFRGTTNDVGIAHVEVPGGVYDVGTWKNGYEIVSLTVDIASDTAVRLELTAAAIPEQPYWT